MSISIKKLHYALAALTFLNFSTACQQSESTNVNGKDQKVEDILFDSTLYQWEGDKIILNWADLMDICFEQIHDDSLQMDVDIPRFGEKLSAINGREVIVEGYYIPVDETGNNEIVILSAFPFSQCFFCGQAGVESIMDILVSNPLPKMKTDSKVRFKGKLKLNDRNFDFLIYILEDAVLYPKQ